MDFEKGTNLLGYDISIQTPSDAELIDSSRC